MPSPDQHLQQYYKNKKSLNKILSIPNPPYDWAVTICFYAALHLVSKVVVDFNPKAKIGKHDDITNVISMISTLKPIRSLYSNLLHESWLSRYMCVPIDKRIVDQSIQHLEEIENRLKKYIQ